MQHDILRLPAAQAASGLSRSTIYARIEQGLFVQLVKLGPRAVGVPAEEVAMLNAAAIAGKSEAEIRALVTKLHLARAGALAALDASQRSTGSSS